MEVHRADVIQNLYKLPWVIRAGRTDIHCLHKVRHFCKAKFNHHQSLMRTTMPSLWTAVPGQRDPKLAKKWRLVYKLLTKDCDWATLFRVIGQFWERSFRSGDGWLNVNTERNTAPAARGTLSYDKEYHSLLVPVSENALRLLLEQPNSQMAHDAGAIQRSCLFHLRAVCTNPT